MDLNALRLFVDIVDAGNLSAAARKLKMTRANVSYHLKGRSKRNSACNWLRRTPRTWSPRPVGAGLYGHGRNILGEVAAAQRADQQHGQSLQGHVQLSVPTGLGHSLLSPLLVRYNGDVTRTSRSTWCSTTASTTLCPRTWKWRCGSFPRRRTPWWPPRSARWTGCAPRRLPGGPRGAGDTGRPDRARHRVRLSRSARNSRPPARAARTAPGSRWCSPRH